MTRKEVKYRKFADLIHKGMNSTDAARECGSKAKNLSEAGREILKKPETQIYLAELVAASRNESIDNYEALIKKVHEIAFDGEAPATNDCLRATSGSSWIRRQWSDDVSLDDRYRLRAALQESAKRSRSAHTKLDI